MTRARRMLAVLALALPLAVGVAACSPTPASPPSHFGNCPAGEHWQQAKLSNFGWECAP
jgi:hypothetical protein